MNRNIAKVVNKIHLHEQGNDFAYWQTQPYDVRIAVLEEIRREYHAWEQSLQKDGVTVQPRLQKVYRIVKR